MGAADSAAFPIATMKLLGLARWEVSARCFGIQV